MMPFLVGFNLFMAILLAVRCNELAGEGAWLSAAVLACIGIVNSISAIRGLKDYLREP